MWSVSLQHFIKYTNLFSNEWDERKRLLPYIYYIYISILQLVSGGRGNYTNGKGQKGCAKGIGNFRTEVGESKKEKRRNQTSRRGAKRWGESSLTPDA